MSGSSSGSGTFSNVFINNSSLGTQLQQLLLCDEIVPGSDASYNICKTIFLYHPLGGKMAETPIMMAQSAPREISIQKGPEERVREAFQAEWKKLRADHHIFNVMRTSRIYGVASIVIGAVDTPTDEPLDPFELAGLEIYFNVLDPLNTAGSLTLNQDPNSPDFQKVTGITVQGKNYHRSRSCVILNESPIYIAWTASAYGYVGRSVYHRALYPLKSFVQSMITDDMVTRKAGVLIAKMKPPGSIIDNLMQGLAALKRNMLVEARTDNVLGITPEESIESLNLQNVDGANGAARKNILENIATAAQMPAKLLLQETFAEGFGEGTEDAKHVAQYIDRMRIEMEPLYAFFDRIVQHRAWNEDFYKTVQHDFPEYADVPYKRAFYDWQNSFNAQWPSVLAEPDSEKIKTDDVKLKSIISMLEVMLPNMDPDNKVKLLEWAADNFNENEMLFTIPLVLDWEALKNYEPPQPAPGAEGQGDEGGGQQLPPNETGGAIPKPPKPGGLQRAA